MIKGRIVGLRAIEQDDLPQLLEWRNEPSLRRYFREYRELNSRQQLDWFENRVNGDLSTRMFAVVELSSKILLGAAGLCYIDWINRAADFSIYIGADGIYIDEMFAPDAARIMISYAFDELCLHRLWSEIYDFDSAKTRFFEGIGFKLDGRHRSSHWAEGRWHDSLIYSLLSTDYAQR